MGFASRALRIRAGEWRTTALMVALMFVSMSAIAIGESGIDALFFDRIGTHALPLMYLAQAGATLVAMFALTTVLDRMRHETIYIWSPIALAGLVLVERALVQTGVRWIYPALWITVAFAMLAQGIGLWGTAGAVTDTRQAKRLFPLFAAGGILGSVLGGLLTRPLATALGADNLLFVWAAGLAAAFLLCRLVLGAAPAPRPRRRGRGSPLRDIAEGFGYLRRSRLLVAMAAAAVLFSVLFYSLFLPFARAATDRFPNADELAGFFGLVGAAVTGAAFLVSMLLTNRLFAWLGVAAMVLVLPLLYTASFSILLVESGFVTIVMLRVMTGVWLQGVASPAWETLVNVVPDDRRDQVRAFLNGGPSQVGTAIAGLVALVGQDVLSPRGFAAIGLVAALATLAAALAIRGSYEGALLEALRAGRPRVFEKPSTWTPMPLALDAETGRVLERSLRSDDLRERRLAFQLAAELPAEGRDAGLQAAVARGLEDPDTVVRLGAIHAVSDPSGAERDALLRLVEDPDPEVAAAASARALASGDVAPATDRLDHLLRDDNAGVRRSVLEQLSLAPSEVAASLSERTLADPAPEVRAAALERLAAAAPDRALEPAIAGIHDIDPAVRIAAGRALGAAGPSAIGTVLSALADPATYDAGVEAARRFRADPGDERVRVFVGAAADRVSDDRSLAAAIATDGEAEGLLRDAIVDRAHRLARSALWAAAMLSPRPDGMHTAIGNLDGAPGQLANALEALDAAGNHALVRPLLTAWEPLGNTTVDGDPLARALDDDDPTVRRCAELVRARREGGIMARSPAVPLMERVLLLRRVHLFQTLPPSDLERVAEIAEERGYADGETIAVQGELGDELHIVTEGTIRVLQDRDGSEHELARRGEGEVVGEMSLLTRMPRVASLVADGGVRTIRIGGREFESMLRERPEVALGVLRVLAHRLAESTGTADRPAG